MSQRMALAIDQEADAAYVTVSDAQIVRTQEIDENRMVDYDGAGAVVGIEFLNVSLGVELIGLPFHDELADLFREHRLRALA